MSQLTFKVIPTKFIDMDFVKVVFVNLNGDIVEQTSADFIHHNLDEAIDYFESVLKDLKQQKFEEEE